MPGPIRSEKSIIRQSADIKDTKKTQKVNQMDQQKVSRRQELASEAHIQRMRKSSAPLSQPIDMAKARRKLSPGAAPTKVSTRNPNPKSVSHCSQKPIAASILLESRLNTKEDLAAKRTREYVGGSVTTTTYTSINDSDRSTPPPYGGSDTGSSTGRSSSCDCHKADLQKIQELAVALNEEEKKNYALVALNDRVGLELDEFNKRYQQLEARYALQRAERMADKQKADEAFWSYEAARSRSQEAEEELKALRMDFEDIQEEKEMQLRAKDQSIAQLEDNQKCALSVIKVDYEKTLHAKDVQLEQAMALVKEKEADLAAVKAKGTEDLRSLARTAEINRKAWLAKQTELEFRIQQTNSDACDTIQTQKDEIERLTEAKRRLEAFSDVMARAVQGTTTIDEAIRTKVSEADSIRVEYDNLRRQNTILEEKIENVLESMQQERNHWDTQLGKEKKAQEQVYGLVKTVAELEEKLAHRDDVLKGLGVQVDGAEQYLGRQQIPQVTPSMPTAVLDIILENDRLKVEIKAMENDHAAQRRAANKVDGEYIELICQIGDMEAKLHQQDTELEVLRQHKTSSKMEIKFLNNAVVKNGDMTDEDRLQLRNYLRDTTNQVQALKKHNSELREEVERCRVQVASVRGEVDHEMRKVQKSFEFYFAAYYDEAIPRAEALYKEIIELNAEMGRDIKPKEQLVRNQRVADRAALRCACYSNDTLVGVATDNIPLEYYEPGFVAGWVPATNDALRVLRPLGWIPVFDEGKTWLQPMYKPFTEEDAVARSQARQAIEEQARRSAQEMSKSGDLPDISARRQNQ
ncbi:hypothetical protein FB567DRAFT_347712 [Paraphoma chrysanthemicola]|uniref:Uncharacterized protein n=1 Tax=Paraphoma chrysanthemicola TaxID=798071 RepID=A0A8K0R703_9PLEO|nr:hypothetical protein FB567DRAFT_347712 [Paraphoma chrysanthemicola]